jgi:hypothetical protein
VKSEKGKAYEEDNIINPALRANNNHGTAE